MAQGDGVSILTLATNKWKLRWREKVDGEWKSRRITVEGGAIERDRLQVEIRTALADTGRYEPATSAVLPAPPPPAPVVAANFADILEACVAEREGDGKYQGKTAMTYRAYSRRVLKSIREIKGLGREGAVPVSLLEKSLFKLITKQDVARGASTMMAYAPARFAIDAWKWAMDENKEALGAGRPLKWPGLPPAPVASKDYLPRTPKYGRTVAPTLEHIDTIIRRLWARAKVEQGTKIAALLMRYTGLRSSEVFGVRREDFDLANRTLLVRNGKTEQEKLDQRTVPLSAQLMGEPGFVAWVESFERGTVFPKRNHSRAKDVDSGRTKQPSEMFRIVWQEATDAGEVPEHVWNPPNRRLSRPEHSFRAAFQAHLEESRIPGNVIDFLVGHNPETVQDTNYGRDLLRDARAAVDAIPAVDWVGPLPETGNVVKGNFGRSG